MTVARNKSVSQPPPPTIIPVEEKVDIPATPSINHSCLLSHLPAILGLCRNPHVCLASVSNPSQSDGDKLMATPPFPHRSTLSDISTCLLYLQHKKIAKTPLEEQSSQQLEVVPGIKQI